MPIIVYNSMYACMYLFMYAYVCMYVCMCVYVCMYVCMSVCLYVCMSVCMHACMYVHVMYVCTLINIVPMILICAAKPSAPWFLHLKKRILWISTQHSASTIHHLDLGGGFGSRRWPFFVWLAVAWAHLGSRSLHLTYPD